VRLASGAFYYTILLVIFYEIIIMEICLLKTFDLKEDRHSGQAKRDPESSLFKAFWIPAPAPDPDPGFAGMTELGDFCKSLLKEADSPC
jgi:hypothetical protein